MAESSPTEKRNSSTESSDTTVLHSGEVFFNGKRQTLSLLKARLKLVAPPAPDKTKGATDDNVIVLDVSWQDVISATEPPVKKRRYAAKALPEPARLDSRHCKSFVLSYIKRDEKSHKLRCRSITLEAQHEACDNWIMQIEDRRKEGKPQKLLVVINPIGGKGNGRQLFEKQVLPIFALAGVELVVKMTERPQQAIEIAKTFDVKSVDGVVVLGGDGMYMETLHGLTLRKQEEEGVNFDDPDARLVPPTVRVGIIPGGTGNGVAAWLNGIIDVETATLNIIRGELCRNNIFSIHEAGKLISYSGLLIANGFFSTLIKRTDELRWMRRARYPYALMSTMLKKKQGLEYVIEVLKKPDNRESITAEGPKKEWTNLGNKHFEAYISFPLSISTDQEQLSFRLGSSTYDLLLLDKASALDYIKIFIGILKKKRSVLEKEFVEMISGIEGMRFKLVQDVEDGAGSSRQQTELNELAKILDVDGELVYLSAPTYEVRLHTKFLQVFCSSEVSQGKT